MRGAAAARTYLVPEAGALRSFNQKVEHGQQLGCARRLHGVHATLRLREALHQLQRLLHQVDGARGAAAELLLVHGRLHGGVVVFAEVAQHLDDGHDGHARGCQVDLALVLLLHELHLQHMHGHAHGQDSRRAQVGAVGASRASSGWGAPAPAARCELAGGGAGARACKRGGSPPLTTLPPRRCTRAAARKSPPCGPSAPASSGTRRPARCGCRP